MSIFKTTSLMITIQQFYVPPNCRKEVYSNPGGGGGGGGGGHSLFESQ